jgi:hypothetical protein
MEMVQELLFHPATCGRVGKAESRKTKSRN